MLLSSVSSGHATFRSIWLRRRTSSLQTWLDGSCGGYITTQYVAIDSPLIIYICDARLTTPCAMGGSVGFTRRTRWVPAQSICFVRCDWLHGLLAPDHVPIYYNVQTTNRYGIGLGPMLHGKLGLRGWEAGELGK